MAQAPSLEQVPNGAPNGDRGAGPAEAGRGRGPGTEPPDQSMEAAGVEPQKSCLR